MRLLALLLALLLSVPAAEAKVRLRSLHHIAIDPGHGGQNHGTAGSQGVWEKVLTLPIALKLEALLLARTDARVTMTRRDDSSLGLRERTRIANKAGADLFLSIHLNAGLEPDAHGVEVYFLSADVATGEIAKLVLREEPQGPGAPSRERTPLSLDQMLADAQLAKAHADSELVAEVILDSLHRVLGSPRRGVFQAPFGVLLEAQMPAVVVEVGFLSHPIEGKRLTKAPYQRNVALAIYQAILTLDREL